MVPGLSVVSRAEWGCDESVFSWTPTFLRAQCITVHHSAISAGNGNYAAAVRGIYRYHAVTNGWGDVGYHLLIDPNGTVYQGRSTGRAGQAVFRSPTGALASPTGGHVFNANDGNVGICLLGDFTGTEPTSAAVESLRRVLAVLCGAMGLDPVGSVRYTNATSGRSATKPSVTGHRDWADFAGSTSCPGDRLYPRLPDIRRRAR